MVFLGLQICLTTEENLRKQALSENKNIREKESQIQDL